MSRSTTRSLLAGLLAVVAPAHGQNLNALDHANGNAAFLRSAMRVSTDREILMIWEHVNMIRSNLAQRGKPPGTP